MKKNFYKEYERNKMIAKEYKENNKIILTVKIIINNYSMKI